MPQSLPVPDDSDLYPSSDGQPMAETSIHAECIIYVLGALQWWFATRPGGGASSPGATARRGHASDDGAPGVYVAANQFLYYERGNLRAVVAPDVFVVHGVAARPRNSYRLWTEPRGPDFVLEVTSKSTKDEDLVKKRAVYASLGVAEYFLYDPWAEYLAPPLQGYRLHGGVYEALASVAVLPGGGRSVHSAMLGLELREAHGGAPWLRLHDPVTGQDLPTFLEEAAARKAAEARAEQEAAAREAAEARAGREATAREAAEARAGREATAREAAEAQVAELKARLQDMENAPAHSHRGPRRSSR